MIALFAPLLAKIGVDITKISIKGILITAAVIVFTGVIWKLSYYSHKLERKNKIIANQAKQIEQIIEIHKLSTEEIIRQAEENHRLLAALYHVQQSAETRLTFLKEKLIDSKNFNLYLNCLTLVRDERKMCLAQYDIKKGTGK